MEPNSMATTIRICLQNVTRILILASNLKHGRELVVDSSFYLQRLDIYCLS